MTSYSVRAIKSPGWRNHKDAILAISVGKEYHEGEKLDSTIQWAVNHFDRLHLLLADTLQRFNFYGEGAERKALIAGDLWLRSNLPLLKATGMLTSVTRWDDLIKTPDYQGVLSQVQQAAEQNSKLRDALQSDVSRFLARQTVLRPDSAARSEAYILEEMAAFVIYGRKLPGARLYPGKNLESLHLVEAQEIPEAPQGMERQQRVALVIRSHKSGAADQQKQIAC